jgi:hypothetical protein
MFRRMPQFPAGGDHASAITRAQSSVTITGVLARCAHYGRAHFHAIIGKVVLDVDSEMSILDGEDERTELAKWIGGELDCSL